MTLKRPKEFSSIFLTEISAIENISTTAMPEPYNNPLQRPVTTLPKQLQNG
jgi:hypothetical protein